MPSRNVTCARLAGGVDERKRRGREIQDRIGRILYEEWDPLGLCGIAPPDEYDFYIGGVYRQLASGASSEQIAEYLGALERDLVGGLATPAAHKMTAARKLRELDLRV